MSITVKQQAYQQAYNKSLAYFNTLSTFSQQQLDVNRLNNELQHWQQQQSGSLLWRLSHKLNNLPLDEFQGTIRYLLKHQQLRPFIDRSVEYIYLRDLGKAIHTDKVQQQCTQTSTQLQQWLLASLDKPTSQALPVSDLFEKLQQWGLQDSFTWLYEKILCLQKRLPEGIDPTRVIRQISKLTLGVLLHQLDGVDFSQLSNTQRQRIDHAIKVGYYYGLTYPFIDDFLDAESILTTKEKTYVSAMIRDTLENNQVAYQPIPSDSPHHELIQFVYQELSAGFTYIQTHYPPEEHNDLYNAFYGFFHAQEIDRDKSLNHAHYSNEELFVPCILKAYYSRILPKILLGQPLSEEFQQTMLLTGLFNQLHDDLSDLSADRQANAVTPYSYYLKYQQQRPDLINPYQIYWSLIQYVGIDIYGENNNKVLHALLQRALNNHVQQRQQYGKMYLRQLLIKLDFGQPEFIHRIYHYIKQYCAPPYLDKLLKINIEKKLQHNHHDVDHYQTEFSAFSRRFNQQLPLVSQHRIDQPLCTAANYAVQAGGKRLRPWLSYLIGHMAYGISDITLLPLLRSIEYMHTASLIFDDLPSQDNAHQRRGSKSLHRHCDSTATAELSALMLIFQAIEQQSNLLELPPQQTLKLIHYSAQISQNICHGQQLDLHSQSITTQAQLEQLSHYKTGYAIEAALVMPAILAQASQCDIQALKQFAYHAGLVFQIKDDLLDSEGDAQRLGKATHMDTENQSSFVTVLGNQAARSLMWQHYFQALNQLKQLSFSSHMLKYSIDLMLIRES